MSIVDTPFKLVETIKDLEVMCHNLQTIEEFAVDLEHNLDRCSRGRTCLILISTRAEDYVVDSLKMRSHIEEHMKSIFMDPAKKKVRTRKVGDVKNGSTVDEGGFHVVYHVYEKTKRAPMLNPFGGVEVKEALRIRKNGSTVGEDKFHAVYHDMRMPRRRGQIHQ